MTKLGWAVVYAAILWGLAETWYHGMKWTFLILYLVGIVAVSWKFNDT